MALTRSRRATGLSTIGEDSSTLRRHTDNDAVNDLQQVTVFAERRIDPLQEPAFLMKNIILYLTGYTENLFIP